MKISRLAVLGVLVLGTTAQPAAAAINQCNENFCSLPTVDCGATGANSDALRLALTTPVRDEFGKVIIPKALNISFAGTCIGPFVIAPTSEGKSIAEQINISASSVSDPEVPVGDPILTGSGNSQILIIDSATVNISGVTFRNGRGGPSSGYNGGAIANLGYLSVSNCRFENNVATNLFIPDVGVISGVGGAIYNARTQNCRGGFDCSKAGSLNVKYTTFINNDTTSGIGAAIYNNGGPFTGDQNHGVEISNSYFRDNGTNPSNNGVIVNNSSGSRGTLIVNSSTFDGSAPERYQILNYNADVYINNSTMAEKSTVKVGYGIYNYNGVVTLNYSTIAYKNVGIYTLGPSGVTIIRSSIVAQNTFNCFREVTKDYSSQFFSDTFSLTDVSPLDDKGNRLFPCGQDASRPAQVSPEQLKLAEFADYGGSIPGTPLPVVPVNPDSIAAFFGDSTLCASTDPRSLVSNVDEHGTQRPQPLPRNPLPDVATIFRASLKQCTTGAFEIPTDDINFGGIKKRFYGQQPFILPVTTLSNPDGLPELNHLTFRSFSPSVCILDGQILNILAVGKCEIEANTPNLVATLSPPPPPNQEARTSTPSYYGVVETQTYDILPAPLTITGPVVSKVYGDPLPPLVPSYDGLQYDDVAPSQVPTCTNSVSVATPVRELPYPTSCTGASDPNYAISYSPGGITVTPAPLVIKASSGGEMNFGSTSPLDVTYASVDGLKNVVSGEDESVLASIHCGFVNKQNNNAIEQFTSMTPAGVYQTACVVEAANYVAAPPPNCIFPSADPLCTFATVKKAQMTITASSSVMIYGDAPPAIFPIYSGLPGNTLPSVEPTCSTNATSASHVSGNPYVSTCSGASDPNYTIVYKPGVVTINPSRLIVTASSVEQLFGNVPQVTPIYSGFKGSDDASILTKEAKCVTNTQGLSPISGNPYVSSCFGADSTDYFFEYRNGVVTVKRGELNIVASSPSIIYGEPIPSITAIFVGLGEVPTSSVLPPTCVTTATNTSEPGTYRTSCSSAKADNFTITYTDGALTIKKVPTLTTVGISPNTIVATNSTIEVSVKISAAHTEALAGRATVIASTGEACSAEVLNGVAKCNLVIAARSVVTITAIYQGNQHFNSSSSEPVFLGIASQAVLNAVERPEGAEAPGCSSVANARVSFHLFPLFMTALAFLGRSLRRRVRQ